MGRLSESINLIELLCGTNWPNLKYEIETLYGIKDWALRNLGIDYKEGDRVKIVSDEPSSVDRNSGWYQYREALAVGRTGRAGAISYSAYNKLWHVYFITDTAWSVHEEMLWNGEASNVRRYWKGKYEDTPDGMTPPGDYDREHHPDGKEKLFSMRLDWLAKAEED